MPYKITVIADTTNFDVEEFIGCYPNINKAYLSRTALFENQNGIEGISYVPIDELMESVNTSDYLDCIEYDEGGGFRIGVPSFSVLPSFITLRICASLHGSDQLPVYLNHFNVFYQYSNPEMGLGQWGFVASAYGTQSGCGFINNETVTISDNTPTVFEIPLTGYRDSRELFFDETKLLNKAACLTFQILKYDTNGGQVEPDNLRIYAIDFVVSNQFDEIGSGGAIVGGSYTKNLIYQVNGTGGAIVGPHHDPVYYFDVASGGVVVSGQGLKSFTMTVSGGVRVGGVANDYYYGGVKVGGGARITSPIYHYPNSPENSLPIITISGSSTIRRTYFEIAKGGGVVGGSVWNFFEMALGGAVLAGGAVVSKLRPREESSNDDIPIDGVGVAILSGYTAFENIEIDRGKTINYAEVRLRCVFVDPFAGSPLSPDDVEIDNSIGTQDWIDPENVLSGGLYATTSGSDQLTSHYLKVNNFNVNLGQGVYNYGESPYISGIEVMVTRKAAFSTVTNYVKDSSVRLVIGGIPIGIEKAKNDSWGTSDQIITYGSPFDVWNIPLTFADLNYSDFGVAVAVDIDSDSSNTAYIQDISINIYVSELQGVGDLNGRTFGILDDNPQNPANWELTFSGADTPLMPDETGYVYLNVTCVVQELIDRQDWNEIIKLEIIATTMTEYDSLINGATVFYDFNNFTDEEIFPGLTDTEEFNLAKIDIWWTANIFNNIGGDQKTIYLPTELTDRGRWQDHS